MYCGRTQCLYTRCSDGWASRRWRVTVTFYCAVHLASRPTPLTAWSTNALGERASNVLGRCTRNLRRQDSGLHSPPIDPGLPGLDSATFSPPRLLAAFASTWMDAMQLRLLTGRSSLRKLCAPITVVHSSLWNNNILSDVYCPLAKCPLLQDSGWSRAA